VSILSTGNVVISLLRADRLFVNLSKRTPTSMSRFYGVQTSIVLNLRNN